ncbi:YkvA family protein [Catenuloplanes atrovinosus]|uniref:DUF1232 domain-containing protein n=1 Tax=Catenuloplanes atrovinosus TaxID=137266 RepID=A0AAE3YI17_9ACTN|nr:YkvA family protein [Catenuloplanes atrovinosus]MDR7273815.1 hypothetical protein [Catenuloplanes atrovinosus]
MSVEDRLLIAGIALLALAMLAGVIVLGFRVWKMRRMLTELGAGGKFAFWGAIIYTISPVDLLPDPILLDDLGLLAGSLVYLTHLVRKVRASRAAQVQPPHGPGPQLRAPHPTGSQPPVPQGQQPYRPGPQVSAPAQPQQPPAPQPFGPPYQQSVPPQPPYPPQ